MTAPPYVSPTPDDLGLYMNDGEVYAARATYMIGQAETLCTAIVAPLPPAAVVVVVRVAARAYITVTTARQMRETQNTTGHTPAAGGVYLTATDKADLRRLAGGSNAFSVNLLAGYTPPALPPWDDQGTVTIETS